MTVLCRFCVGFDRRSWNTLNSAISHLLLSTGERERESERVGDDSVLEWRRGAVRHVNIHRFSSAYNMRQPAQGYGSNHVAYETLTQYNTRTSRKLITVGEVPASIPGVTADSILTCGVLWDKQRKWSINKINARYLKKQAPVFEEHFSCVAPCSPNISLVRVTGSLP